MISGHSLILLCSLSSPEPICRTVVAFDVAPGSDLAVDPKDAVLFFSSLVDPEDFEPARRSMAFRTRIERVGMDGSDRRVLVSFEQAAVGGCALDHLTRQLYWINMGKKRIEVVDYDGKNR